MKGLITFFTLLGLVILTSCGGGDSSPTIEPRTGDDVREDFLKLDIQPGINDLTLESTTENFYWNFRLIVPEEASATNKRPLVLSLHGGASNVSADAHKTTSCLVEPGFEDLNAYIISPNSKGYFWYDQQNQIQVLALLDLLKSYLFVDENKVLVTGYSDGGNGSWFYADYYPQLFSAAIPMASSYNTVRSDDTVSQISIPMYVIHGENDYLFPVAQTEEWVNLSIDAGSSIEFVVAPELTHYQYCDYLSYLKEAATWVDTEVWN